MRLFVVVLLSPCRPSLELSQELQLAQQLCCKRLHIYVHCSMVFSMTSTIMLWSSPLGDPWNLPDPALQLSTHYHCHIHSVYLKLIQHVQYCVFFFFRMSFFLMFLNFWYHLLGFLMIHLICLLIQNGFCRK
jgi:hypothetical protein